MRLNQSPKQCQCGETRFRKIPGAQVRTLAHGGTLPDGTEYSAVQWEDKKCSACGQVRAIRTLLP